VKEIELPQNNNAPDLVNAPEVFSEFLKTVAALRHPETGCPWDLEQNHRTLARFMIEEAYEASEQMTSGDGRSELCAELGDVLLQVVLNAQLASDDGRFSIVDVIKSIDSKMKRRHPHVFGNEEERRQRDLHSIKLNWIAIKEKEKEKEKDNDKCNDEEFEKEEHPQKAREAKASDHQLDGFDQNFLEKSAVPSPFTSSAASHSLPEQQVGIFQISKVDKVFPAAIKAHKIGEIARRIRFDWKDPWEVLDKLESEISELRQAMHESRDDFASKCILDELGDVYFSINQLARHLGTNGEIASELGNQKFLARFKAVESLAVMKGISIEKCSQSVLEALWSEAKKNEILT